MFKYVYRHRVRYRECDRMGIVYHTHYLDYFEAARTEALRALGLAYKTLEDTGILMPIVDLAVQYRQPAEYDDLLDILAFFRERPVTRFRIDYEIFRMDDPTLLVTGHVTLCFIDRKRNRPIRAPEQLASIVDLALSG